MISRLVPLEFRDARHARRTQTYFLAGLATGLTLMVSGLGEGRLLQSGAGFAVAYVFLTAWDLAKPAQARLYDQLMAALGRGERDDLLGLLREWEARIGYITLKQLKHVRSQLAVD